MMVHLSDTFTHRSERNSEIELFRFVAAFIIMSFHLGFIFNKGWILVEFFFILSGILMAQTATKLMNNNTEINIGVETKQYILKKIKTLLPYLVISYVICLMTYLYQDGFTLKFGKELLNEIPNYLLLKQGGFNLQYRLEYGYYWFISALIIGQLILFPIYLKMKDSAKYIIMPLIFIFSIGYLINNNNIGANNIWLGFISGGLLRGIGEMALGAFCYEICIYLKKIKLTKVGKTIISLFLLLLIIVLLIRSTGELADTNEYLMIFITAMILIIMYSEIQFSLPHGNRVCCYLGSLSLPLYLLHIPIGWFIVRTIMGNEWYHDNKLIVELIVIIATILCVFCVTNLKGKKIIDKIKAIIITTGN